MKKIIATLILLTGLSNNMAAQAPLKKGNAQLNAGLGLSGWGTPVYLGFDFGVGNEFTLGVEGSYRSYNKYYDKTYKSSILGIQGNANYHLNKALDIPSKWDFYAGLSLNYFRWSTNNKYYNYVDESGFGLGGQIGGRYFINKNFGLNLEISTGSSTTGGKFGITYKL